MDTNNQEVYEEQSAAPRRKKKKKKGWIIFLIILILAVAGGTGFYFMQRQKPISATEDFLENMRAMNFDGMKNLLQSNDMSALDNADITSDAYSSFFKKINEKMTYKIGKTNFHIQNGTASVTVHTFLKEHEASAAFANANVEETAQLVADAGIIEKAPIAAKAIPYCSITYIDGADIYKETISEFLKQIVSTAFSGTTLTEEETQQKLASLLEEKSGSVEDKFTSIDITYPLIEADGKWKIVSLDADTVKVMSANFTNVQDEINQSLAEMNNSENAGVEATVTPAETTSIDMDNDHFTLRLKEFRVTQAIDDSDCLLLYCDYTNNSSSSSSALVDVQLSAKQNGEKLSPAVPKEDEPAIDNYIAEVEPGSTVTVCYAFSLNDKSDVTLEASEAFAFGGGNVTSQTIKLQ